jgi:gamma-glutamylcyclotransferase (GGCT)/AIG2-like uncharacterized protein YtfP
MLPDLVRKYALIGMSSPEISKILGELYSADEQKTNMSYELNFPTCGDVARLYLELEFRQDRVWRYRLEEIDTTPGTTIISHSNWVTSNFTLKALGVDEVKSSRLDKLFLTKSIGQPQFTEQHWKSRPDSGAEFQRNRRLNMLPDLVHKHALIGLSLNELSHILGKPQSIDDSKEHLVYELNFPVCNSSPQLYFEVELRLDQAWRFRIKEINPLPEGDISYSTWVTSNF